MYKFVNSWVGGTVVITGWVFLLLACGFELYTDRVSFVFLASLVSALASAYWTHHIHVSGGPTNGPTTPSSS